MARILVIEDDPPSLELIRYLLVSAGHSVRCSDDGLTGWREARGGDVDLIVCDVQLPGLDGLQLARRLKGDATLRVVPLVAVTASAMVGDRRSVMAAGFDVYIAKPIVPETFVDQIMAVLGGVHAPRQG
jgi:two-component system cell cycle response regulator